MAVKGYVKGYSYHSPIRLPQPSMLVAGQLWVCEFVKEEMEKNTRWRWTTREEDCLQELKKRIPSSNCLGVPGGANFTWQEGALPAPPRLEGGGGVLLQGGGGWDGMGHLSTVYFESRGRVHRWQVCLRFVGGTNQRF